ncbi:hypothetical protein GCM10023094_55420 [Rhodococcus olei]|uniref:Uncharacterized protein n=1 Tax=Rhodococcus olei TaxID=2161675 RepID=A0ABP8PTI3_9NOCA
MLTVDGGIEWWGDGYPSLSLSPEHAGSKRTADPATLDARMINARSETITQKPAFKAAA